VERSQRFIITLSGDPGGGYLPFQSVVRAETRSPGLGIGVIVLALTMAAGCARGVSRRLAEYR